MRTDSSRRRFLKSSLTGVATIAAAGPVPIGLAQSDAVRLDAEIEPLVRLLESTARSDVLEVIGARVQAGLRYEQLLAALLLAGVRNIQPRPVGFKFHAVMVVHAVHLASRGLPANERWLPIFWAIDDFKRSQFRDVLAGDWTMGPVADRLIPTRDKAIAAFSAAMDAWDEPAADAAAAGLARHLSPVECFETLLRFGARDYRDIGHKAIYLANGWRTLQTIGWQHAEPVVRSLAYAMLNHRGWTNPARSDDIADRPWRRNLGLVHSIRSGWQAGALEMASAIELLDVLRTGSHTDAADSVIALLNRNVASQAIVDACFLFAAELMMKRPGILALHAVTTTNALQYAYRASSSDESRRLLLLQNASFLVLFRDDTLREDEKATPLIDRFEAMRPAKAGEAGIDELFGATDRDRARLTQNALGYLRNGGAASAFLARAQQLVGYKGSNAHDFKYSTAVFEDFAQISPAWRDRYLAAAMAWLCTERDRDNPLVARTRAALLS